MDTTVIRSIENNTKSNGTSNTNRVLTDLKSKPALFR